jgi:hypothetical protein
LGREGEGEGREERGEKDWGERVRERDILHFFNTHIFQFFFSSFDVWLQQF